MRLLPVALSLSIILLSGCSRLSSIVIINYTKSTAIVRIHGIDYTVNGQSLVTERAAIGQTIEVDVVQDEKRSHSVFDKRELRKSAADEDVYFIEVK